jgi:hypothetical protein
MREGQDCFIFDLDGTLANGEHRVHFIRNHEVKDWDSYFLACTEDTPILHVVRLARILYGTCPVIIVTGRSRMVEEQTRAWLWRYTVPHSDLYMREERDYRNDDVLKVEMLAQIRADGWRPIMAFEDRTRVVRAYRAAGLPCAQVAEGDF